MWPRAAESCGDHARLTAHTLCQSSFVKHNAIVVCPPLLSLSLLPFPLAGATSCWHSLQVSWPLALPPTLPGPAAEEGGPPVPAGARSAAGARPGFMAPLLLPAPNTRQAGLEEGAGQ